jgi:hypothetical protein
MTNLNDPKSSKDRDDIPLTAEEQSFREGYLKGQVGKEELQSQRERAAENSGAASGLVIGGVIATLVGLGAAAFYYWRTPESLPTTIINTMPSPSNSVAPQPEKETKIIERTTEKAASPQIIEVPKPVLIPGETKVIEVPKTSAVPSFPVPPRVDAPKADKSTGASSPAPASPAAKSLDTPQPNKSADDNGNGQGENNTN